MNVIINIENYEAFYLDYLENNLSEEETNAFELFLEQHPELKVDEELPSLVSSENISLNDSFLSKLKIFDVTESITEINAEQFMIASIEEILPASKKIELNDFLAKRNDLRNDYLIYQKTKLQADLNLRFNEKSALKKGVIIPMYAKIISVAASLILIFLLIPIDEKIEITKFAQNKRTDIFKIPYIQSKPITKSSQILKFNHETKKENRNSNKKLIPKNKIEEINPLKLNQLEPIEINSNSEIVALNIDHKIISTNQSKQNIETEFVAFNEMRNPVAFFTNEINKRFDKDIEVRSAKASNKKQGGFYFKFGKLEISRKITPIHEELAVY